MTEWNAKANALFLEAIDRPAGRARIDFLNEVCVDEVDLKAQVMALLDAGERADDFLSSPAHELLRSDLDLPPLEGPGTVVGSYKLLQQIGEGGMGVVYMAEQIQPVRRMVALKILKPGMDSRNVAARFEAERQALAMMDHPNIARVLDAGTTGGAGQGCAGRPFFVMELVKGIPFTQYCDARQLTPRQRLELFRPVCNAIGHAHQKGIIHRDLKPSNVLVAQYDGQPVPKVIDFGVAKATGPKLTEQTLFTEFGAVIGTLEYMSPEQAELNQLDVDTRSDIYSLGVLLYELLTGSTPLGHKRAKDTSIMELLRLIREVEPPRPSTRLSATEELPVIAACRGLEPKKLSALVRGDLDWVVMKALEKDRNRRYATAEELASDIDRFLANKPVEACPPSAAYRFRLLTRRHKTSVIAAGIIAASLIAATLISLSQATVARRAKAVAEGRMESEQKARRQSIAALAYLLGDTAKAEQWDDIVAQITTIEPADAPEQLDVARVLYWMAEQEHRRGNYRQAVQLARRAVDLYRTAVGEHHLDTARSLNCLGWMLWSGFKAEGSEFDLEEADAAYRQSLRILQEHYRDYEGPVLSVSTRLLHVAQARQRLGVEGQEGTIDEIRRRAERTLARKASGLEPLNEAAAIFVALELWKQAEQCCTRAIDLDRAPASARQTVALLQLVQKDHDGYRATCKEALAHLRPRDFHGNYVVARTCLLVPDSGADRGRIDALVRSAVDARPRNSSYRQALAIAHYRANRLEEAESQFQQSLKKYAESDPLEYQRNVAITHYFLAMIYQRANRPQEAQASLTRAQHAAKALVSHPNLSWRYDLLLRLCREEAEQLVLVGDPEQAAAANRPVSSVSIPSGRNKN
ncbi:MAG: serine/threonine-protein kinase [Pirellulales bacterium]